MIRWSAGGCHAHPWSLGGCSLKFSSVIDDTYHGLTIQHYRRYLCYVRFDGSKGGMTMCEDAPCCGCCGDDTYGGFGD